GVQQQAGSATDLGLDALLAKLRADPGRPAILPDDRPVDRSARLPIPYDDGFPLVRDTDAFQLLERRSCCRRCLARDVLDPGPDLVDIVLHPARLRKILGELPVPPSPDAAVTVDDQT